MASQFASGKIPTLTRKLNAGDSTAYMDSDVGVTSGRLYGNNNLQEEWIGFTGVSASGSEFAYTGLTRGLSQTADPSTASTGSTWLSGQQFALVEMHDQMMNKQKPEPLIFATTAARDTALGADGAATTPWVNVYVTATGLHYNYNLSTAQWETVSTGTPTPNASTTVAGKVEIATQGEVDAGTDTGGTGAKLAVIPSTYIAGFPTKLAALGIYSPIGTGADGALVVTSGTTNINLNQVYNYSSIEISVGATLSSAATGNPMILKCLGTATVNGTILLKGKNVTTLTSGLFSRTVTAGNGGAGGAGGAGGTAGGGGTPGTAGTGQAGAAQVAGCGGGGGGGVGQFAGAGTFGNGGNGTNGGTGGGTGGTAGGAGTGVGAAAYGTAGSNGSAVTSQAAGGNATGASSGGGGGAGYTSAGNNAGGGGGGSGGNGQTVLQGGALVLYANAFSGSGTIDCSGAAGNAGGAGGNGGGNGGNAGAGGPGGGSGGGGGGGAIVASFGGAFGGTISVAGGAGGAAGAAGSAYNTGTSNTATAGTAGSSGQSYNFTIAY